MSSLSQLGGSGFAARPLQSVSSRLRVLQLLDARGLYRNSIIMTYTNHTFKDRPAGVGLHYVYANRAASRLSPAHDDMPCLETSLSSFVTIVWPAKRSASCTAYRCAVLTRWANAAVVQIPTVGFSLSQEHRARPCRRRSTDQSCSFSPDSALASHLPGLATSPLWRAHWVEAIVYVTDPSNLRIDGAPHLLFPAVC